MLKRQYMGLCKGDLVREYYDSGPYGIVLHRSWKGQKMHLSIQWFTGKTVLYQHHWNNKIGCLRLITKA